MSLPMVPDFTSLPITPPSITLNTIRSHQHQLLGSVGQQKLYSAKASQTKRYKHKPKSCWKRRMRLHCDGVSVLVRRNGRNHLNVKMSSSRKNRLDRTTFVPKAYARVMKKLAI